MPADSDLIDRVLAGETAVYETLMRRYNQRLFRVIRSVVPDDLEAEDVLQEAWVRAYEHLAQFEGRASFATWVTRIAYYEALARVRAAKRREPIEDAEGEIMRDLPNDRTDMDSPESQAIRGELGRILQSAIDALPETYRSVFVLREVEQLSTQETGDCLGLPLEAVRTRLHRSRAILRRDLQDRMGAAVVEAYGFLGPRCDRTVARVMARIGAVTRT